MKCPQCHSSIGPGTAICPNCGAHPFALGAGPVKGSTSTGADPGIFVNATTGHREEVSNLTWLFALLFGAFYFMFKGVWRHVLIQLVLTAVFYGLLGAPGTIFVFVMWVAYAATARGIVENHLQREGYRPESEIAARPFNAEGSTHPKPPTGSAPAATAASARVVRACPLCAEEILAAARKCKHCGSEVEPLTSTSVAPPAPR